MPSRWNKRSLQKEVRTAVCNLFSHFLVFLAGSVVSDTYASVMPNSLIFWEGSREDCISYSSKMADWYLLFLLSNEAVSRSVWESLKPSQPASNWCKGRVRNIFHSLIIVILFQTLYCRLYHSENLYISTQIIGKCITFPILFSYHMLVT